MEAMHVKKGDQVVTIDPADVAAWKERGFEQVKDAKAIDAIDKARKASSLIAEREEAERKRISHGEARIRDIVRDELAKELKRLGIEAAAE